MEPKTDERQRMGDPRVPQLQARIRDLEAITAKLWSILAKNDKLFAEANAACAALERRDEHG